MRFEFLRPWISGMAIARGVGFPKTPMSRAVPVLRLTRRLLMARVESLWGRAWIDRAGWWWGPVCVQVEAGCASAWAFLQARSPGPS